MPTPLHLKPPVAAWIVRERKRLKLKPKDVAVRLAAMGLEVSEATVKVWESNANRRPNPYNLEGLERLFESAAPDQAQVDDGSLVAALHDQTKAISALVSRLDDLSGAVAELLRDRVREGASDRSSTGAGSR